MNKIKQKINDTVIPHEQGRKSRHLDSKAYAVARVPSTCFAWPCDLHYLSTTQPIIAGDRIRELYARQLRLFEAAILRKLRFAGRRAKTHYFSSNDFFSSGVKTSWRGTSVWWVMFTRRSDSENSSRRYWAAMATMTCTRNDRDRGIRETEWISPFAPKESYFQGKQWHLVEWISLLEFQAFWTWSVSRQTRSIGTNKLSHGLNTYTFLIRKKYEDLVTWVGSRRRVEIEAIATVTNEVMDCEEGYFQRWRYSLYRPAVSGGIHTFETGKVHMKFFVGN